MKRLLALELHRFFKQTSTKVIAIILVILSGINVLSAFAVESQFDEFAINARSIIESSFQLGQFQILLIGILTSLFIATDIQQGTIRNKIIAGYSKQTIYLVQMLMSVIITIAALMLFHLLPVIMIPWITFPITSDDAGSLGNFLILTCFGYFLIIVGVLITSWIALKAKNLGGAIIFTLLIFVLGPTITLIARVIIEAAAVVNLDAFSDAELYQNVLDQVNQAFEWIYFAQVQRLSGTGTLFNFSPPLNFSNEEGVRFIWKTLTSNAVILFLVVGLGSIRFAKTDLR
jgi:hypothetical protein